MTRMIRKQIVIDAEREALVSRIADERGASQSEVIRMAIDALSELMRREDERDRAWAELVASFGNAPDLGLTNDRGERNWSRDELHDRSR